MPMPPPASPRRLGVLTVACLLVLAVTLVTAAAAARTAPAAAERPHGREGPGREAAELRRAHNSPVLETSFALPAGTLSVEPAEQMAAMPGATVRLAVRLDRPAPGGELLVTLPE